jgi:hypothetical protein
MVCIAEVLLQLKWKLHSLLLYHYYNSRTCYNFVWNIDKGYPENILSAFKTAMKKMVHWNVSMS